MRALLLLILMVQPAFAQDKEAAQIESLKFDNLKSVLKNDGLSENLKNKKKLIKKKQKARKLIIENKYAYPVKDDFWPFISQFWLVKNAPELSWDFEKPDYGLDYAFQSLLEKIGIYQYKFKILMLNTPRVQHMALPSNKKMGIYTLSLPFLRILDLSKLEISLLLLEDYLRLDEGFFVQNLKADTSIIGKNFVNSRPDIKSINKILKDYNNVVHKKGFSFDQQFKVTKRMDALLKPHPALWSKYIQLLNKIDKLIKVNLLYKTYNDVYPSPEMQIKWLSPKKKIL